MIANRERTVAVSSVGWVDGDALWRFDLRTGAAERLPLRSGARYVSLHCSGPAHFSVAHHFDGGRFEVTLHSFADPVSALGRVTVEDARTAMVGDASTWRQVPLLYAAYLSFQPWSDFVLLRVDVSRRSIEVQRLEWYDGTYDKGYQAITGVLELPGEDMALVSVQRSSELVLHDLQTGGKRRSISLAGRGGNPVLQLRKAGAEVWASDYDTLLVLDRQRWKIIRSARLQRAAVGTQQFIGDYSFTPDERSCAVARPFSGDVVGVDAATLRIRSSATLGRQPLEVTVLPGDAVVARDWKTGDVLRGQLERRRWAGFSWRWWS
jgi:hypothetical protein